MAFFAVVLVGIFCLFVCGVFCLFRFGFFCLFVFVFFCLVCLFVFVFSPPFHLSGIRSIALVFSVGLGILNTEIQSSHCDHE